jgi:hypothetical protein
MYDLKAAELRDKIDGPRRRLKQSLGQLRQRADELDRQIAAVQQDADLTRDAKDERVHELRSKAVEQFRGLRDARDQDVAALKKALARAEQHQSDDPTEALHARMQHEQTWRRIERRLEAMEAKERARVIDELIAEAADPEDVITLRALRAGLPAYLAAEWPGLVPRAQKKVADALLPLAPGVEKTALEVRAELDDPAVDATIAFVGKQILGSATPRDRLSMASR